MGHILTQQILQCLLHSFLVNHWKITIIINTKYAPIPQKAQQPLMDHSFLLIEAARSHSDTPHSLGFLWTSDQPDAEPLPDKTQHCREINIHEHGGIHTWNPSKRTAANPCLRQRGHWYRQHIVFTSYIFPVILRINSDYFLCRINQLFFITENVLLCCKNWFLFTWLSFRRGTVLR